MAKLRWLYLIPFAAWAAWVGASEPMIWAMPSARAVALRVEPVPVSPASPLPSLSQKEADNG